MAVVQKCILFILQFALAAINVNWVVRFLKQQKFYSVCSLVPLYIFFLNQEGIKDEEWEKDKEESNT